MSNEVFIKNFNEYKELLKSNYKAPVWTVPTNLIIFILFSFIVLNTAKYFHSMGAFMFGVTILMIMMAVSMAKIEHSIPSFLQSKFNKKLVLEGKIGKLFFTGRLSDIFNLECIITKDVIAKNYNCIEKQLVENKSINGYTILYLFNEIKQRKEIKSEQEKKQREIEKLQEEKEALIMADTKIGQSLKEIEQIKSESTVEDEKEFKNE